MVRVPPHPNIVEVLSVFADKVNIQVKQCTR